MRDVWSHGFDNLTNFIVNVLQMDDTDRCVCYPVIVVFCVISVKTILCLEGTTGGNQSLNDVYSAVILQIYSIDLRTLATQ